MLSLGISRMKENGAGDKWLQLPLILHLSYQGFQREKNQLFNILPISLFRKCHSTVVGNAHEGTVFTGCIFTSPEANQSHALPNASLSFALVAFYSNSSFTARASSPFHLPCNGVQHSWNATQWWDWVCRSMETWISPRQVYGMLVLIPLMHSPLSPSPVMADVHFRANLACHPQQQTLLPGAAHPATTGETVWMLRWKLAGQCFCYGSRRRWLWSGVNTV